MAWLAAALAPCAEVSPAAAVPAAALVLVLVPAGAAAVANVSGGPSPTLLGPPSVLPCASSRNTAVTGSFSIPLHTSTPPMAMKATGRPGTLPATLGHRQVVRK